MSFQPIIGGGGYAGWKLLARTGEMQKKLVAQDAEVVRDTRHFRENFDDVKTAEDLVSDYRMLRTALSAYGLEADTNNRYFIRKVLESDLDDPKSLANRLGDKRYRALAEAFGMGKGGARAKGLVDTVAERHVVAELERRVGNVDGNLRLAMNAKRELAAVGESDSSDTTRWYNILGSVPLRRWWKARWVWGRSSESSRLNVRHRNSPAERPSCWARVLRPSLPIRRISRS